MKLEHMVTGFSRNFHGLEIHGPQGKAVNILNSRVVYSPVNLEISTGNARTWSRGFHG